MNGSTVLVDLPRKREKIKLYERSCILIEGEDII